MIGSVFFLILTIITAYINIKYLQKVLGTIRPGVSIMQDERKTEKCVFIYFLICLMHRNPGQLFLF